MKTVIWLAVVAVTAGVLTGIARADSFEPDNSSSTAKSITTDGQAQSHSIDPAADEDWLTFSIEALTGVVIETSGISGDTVMSLYNNQVVELLTDDDSGTGSFSRIQTTLPAGTYYVRIKEYNNKALISEYFVSVLASPIAVLSVTPDSAPRGESLAVTITGLNTTFFQGSSTITNVWLSKGTATINANSLTGIDATTAEASFDIPANALAGEWDVHVSNSVDGELPSLVNGFMIYAYPDLNGDGKVDAIDFALLARHWMEATVPNVVGMSEADATTAITDTSLAVGTVTQQYSDTFATGLVISQAPASGAVVNIGSAVNLVISLGKLVVPNVTGITRADAESAIVAAGLFVGTLTEECSFTVVAGTVISQSPPAGEEVLPGSAVNLVISKGVYPAPEGMVWVTINDPGVSGHEGFNGQMSKYETTNAQYCQFLNVAYASGDITVSGSIVYGANGSNSGTDFVGQAYYSFAGYGYSVDGATNGGAARINWTGTTFTVDAGFENHPATYVSWYGSTAFASYYGWRLPTEWEWQAVADYDGSFVYGCGTTITNNIANYDGSTHPNGTTAAGAFGTYGYGMCDMAGNVWEWTSSLYDPGDNGRFLCGGAWYGYLNSCTVSRRNASSLNNLDYTIGFRVCR